MRPDDGSIRRANGVNCVRLLRAAFCLAAACSLLAACQTMTEHVIPHPRHAEKSVHEAVSEVFDGLSRTQRDLERAFSAGGSGDRGRIFLHVRGAGIGPDLAALLHRGIGNMLEDAGYEIVSFEELEASIARQPSGNLPSWDDGTARKAAMSLNTYEGAGAVDVYMSSVQSLGLGEPNLEGEYEERLRIDVTTTAYEAKWGDELFRDRATLKSRSVYKQAEAYYSEEIHGMSTRDPGPLQAAARPDPHPAAPFPGTRTLRARRLRQVRLRPPWRRTSGTCDYIIPSPASVPCLMRRRRSRVMKKRLSMMTRNDTPVVTVPRA